MTTGLVLALIELVVLGGVIYYRGRYLEHSDGRRPDKQHAGGAANQGGQATGAGNITGSYPTIP